MTRSTDLTAPPPTAALLRPPRERPGFWAALWRALEVSGQSRAAGELRRAADHYAITDPELSRRLRAAARRSAID